MAICKTLNPNVEVPEVTDLIQQINEMLESDNTEKTIAINENGSTGVSMALILVFIQNIRITVNISFIRA